MQSMTFGSLPPTRYDSDDQMSPIEPDGATAVDAIRIPGAVCEAPWHSKRNKMTDLSQLNRKRLGVIAHVIRSVT
jgi:hypothetical protein